MRIYEYIQHPRTALPLTGRAPKPGTPAGTPGTAGA